MTCSRSTRNSMMVSWHKKVSFHLMTSLDSLAMRSLTGESTPLVGVVFPRTAISCLMNSKTPRFRSGEFSKQLFLRLRLPKEHFIASEMKNRLSMAGGAADPNFLNTLANFLKPVQFPFPLDNSLTVIVLVRRFSTS